MFTMLTARYDRIHTRVLSPEVTSRPVLGVKLFQRINSVQIPRTFFPTNMQAELRVLDSYGSN